MLQNPLIQKKYSRWKIHVFYIYNISVLFYSLILCKIKFYYIVRKFCYNIFIYKLKLAD